MSNKRTNYLAHPFRFALIAGISTLILIHILFLPQDSILVLATNIAQILLFALSYFRPRESLAICVIMLLLMDFAYASANDCTMYGIILAIGMLSFDTNDVISILLVTGTSLCQIICTDLFSGPGLTYIALPSFIIAFTFAAILGDTLRHHEAKQEKIRLEEQRKFKAIQQQKNDEIANQLHDAVTSELSAAALLAQQQAQFTSNNAKQWKQVNEYIIAALSNVRDVIDRNSQNSANISSEKQNNNSEIYTKQLTIIEKTLNDNDARLHDLGFAGQGKITSLSIPHTINPHVLQIILILLRELYANISRHASSDEPYEISIFIKQSLIEITEINKTKRIFAEKLPGGHGLRQLVDSIQRIGGQTSIEEKEDRWEFYTCFPLK